MPVATRPFCLFFAVERTDDQKAANMSLEYTSLRIETKVTLPSVCGKRGYSATNEGESVPEIPVMFNPKPLKKGTRLMVGHDLDLKKLSDDMAKKAAAEAASKKAKKANEGGD